MSLLPFRVSSFVLFQDSVKLCTFRRHFPVKDSIYGGKVYKISTFKIFKIQVIFFQDSVKICI